MVKLLSNTESENFETYEVKLALFKNGEPEELLIFIRDFRKTLKYMRLIKNIRLSQYLHTLLQGQALLKFDSFGS